MTDKLPLEKKQADFPLLFIACVLLGIGLVMVYSSSQIYAYVEFNDSAYFIKKNSCYGQ